MNKYLLLSSKRIIFAMSGGCTLFFKLSISSMFIDIFYFINHHNCPILFFIEEFSSPVNTFLTTLIYMDSNSREIYF